VQPNRVGQVLNDPARSAADVQGALSVFQKAKDDSIPCSLPVPLQPDRAVKSPVIVIGRSDGVAQSPHPHQGFHEGPSELEEPHVGAAGATGHVMKRHFLNPPTLSLNTEKDLLKEIEVPRNKPEPCQDVAMIQAEPAGQITD